MDNILCMDMLLELFQYFYVDELFNSFNNIIHLFPSILKNGKVQLHIRYIDTHFRKHILPNIEINNVISIRIKNMYEMAPVNLGQFNQVRSLTIGNVTARNWSCDLSNTLTHLTIFVRSKDRREVFKKALGLSNIDRLEFNSTFLHFNECHDILPKPSSIKYLIFNSQCSVIDYEFLLNNMPHLQSLKSINTYYPHRNRINLGRFNYLHTIDLVCKHMDIDAMIFLLTKIAVHSLRRCRLINIENSLLLSGIANVLIS